MVFVLREGFHHRAFLPDNFQSAPEGIFRDPSVLQRPIHDFCGQGDMLLQGFPGACGGFAVDIGLYGIHGDILQIHVSQSGQDMVFEVPPISNQGALRNRSLGLIKGNKVIGIIPEALFANGRMMRRKGVIDQLLGVVPRDPFFVYFCFQPCHDVSSISLKASIL
ncbi:MAG: hypothetical protein PUE61_04730 [Clostridiales bacterium]|nr:hypothetical protein [Clostridiales bacterium]